MHKPILIDCPHCRGKGTTHLSGRYAKTFLLLRGLAKPMNGAQLGRLMGVKPEAMCNRLVRLEELGLAVSERDGQQRLWKAAK